MGIIKRIEHVHSQGIGRVNEDEILIGDSLFGVFDGATSLVGFQDELGRTGGQIASEIAKKAFENSTPTETLKDLIQKAGQTIRQQYQTRGIDIKRAEALWSVNGVAVVRLLGDSFEYVQIGDAMIFAFHTNGRYEILTRDQLHSSDSLVFAKWKEGIEKGLRTQRDLQNYVLPIARQNRYNANVRNGYGSINGQDIPDELICYGKRPLDVATIALVTDGLGVSTENPLEYVDWNKTARILRDREINGLLQYVRKREESDPECLKYIRFKKSDDATGVMVRF